MTSSIKQTIYIYNSHTAHHLNRWTESFLAPADPLNLFIKQTGQQAHQIISEI